MNWELLASKLDRITDKALGQAGAETFTFAYDDMDACQVDLLTWFVIPDDDDMLSMHD